MSFLRVKNNTMLTRRDFLANTATLATGAILAPLAARADTSSKNDILRIGLVGCRNMGWSDLNAMLSLGGTECAALCDVDEGVLSARAGEIARRQGRVPATFGDYRKLLEKKDIDIVLIGTPDHWHCLPFVDACQAGKDIYIQKPFANTVAECDVMVAAAKKHQRVVQVGQQQRGGADWNALVQFVQDGGLGKIVRAHTWGNFGYVVQGPPQKDTAPPAGVDYDMWLGPAPKVPFNHQRFHGNWRCHWNYGGGLVTDWGAHLMDIVLWALKITTPPAKILAHGGKFLSPDGAHETHDTLAVTYLLKDLVFTWENVAANTPQFNGKNYGVRFHGEKGVIVADRGGWDIYEPGGKHVRHVNGDEGNSLRNHHKNFLDCVRARRFDTACPPEAGALVAKFAHLGNIAARVGGGVLEYDDKTKRTNNPAATALLTPNYRAPWRFPRV